MRVTELQAYKLRALSAELEAARANALLAAAAVDAALRSFGLDPTQHVVVMREGSMPIGTVILASTGQPVVDKPAPAPVAPRRPRAGMVTGKCTECTDGTVLIAGVDETCDRCNGTGNLRA